LKKGFELRTFEISSKSETKDNASSREPTPKINILTKEKEYLLEGADQISDPKAEKPIHR